MEVFLDIPPVFRYRPQTNHHDIYGVCQPSRCITATKIGDLEFPGFSAEDRATIIETMTSMKDTLEAAITRAVQNAK